MKLLFLSICGKLDEPEETKYINLYLASLAKFVVPHFEKVKVILLTTYKLENKENSLLQKRINEFGLQDVVELKTIHDLELQKKSLDIITSIDWFNRIGVNMNVLYDYARRHAFFEADWIFHTDTDSEFLEDFPECIKSIDGLKRIHKNIVISLAGDAYNANIVNSGTEYIFDEPTRINFYDEENINRPSTQLQIIEKQLSDEDHRKKYEAIVFSPAQMKIRNDFVGISRAASHSFVPNWVFAHYDYKFKDNGPIENFWPINALKKTETDTPHEIPMPEIRLNYHMGGMLKYKIQSNDLNVTHVQLPGYTHAMLHHSSGWFQTHFIDRSIQSLNLKFEDTKHIWETDYLTNEQIKTKIQKLQEELEKLQNLLN